MALTSLDRLAIGRPLVSSLYCITATYIPRTFQQPPVIPKGTLV
jgi:hypothetical protein